VHRLPPHRTYTDTTFPHALPLLTHANTKIDYTKTIPRDTPTHRKYGTSHESMRESARFQSPPRTVIGSVKSGGRCAHVHDGHTVWPLSTHTPPPLPTLPALPPVAVATFSPEEVVRPERGHTLERRDCRWLSIGQKARREEPKSPKQRSDRRIGERVGSSAPTQELT
jgi:hypothetical protein